MMPESSSTQRGPLVIVAGPSGVGKSTVIGRLLATTSLPLRLSVSATTRAIRPGEQPGKSYHYWTVPEFEAAIAAGDFLEFAKVHERDYYGTLSSEVEPYRRQGIGVVLDIDVQGAAQVREKIPDHLSVFLRLPGDRYEERIRLRGSDSEEAIQRRLRSAMKELAVADTFHVQLVNEDLERTVAQLEAIIRPLFAPRESSCLKN